MTTPRGRKDTQRPTQPLTPGVQVTGQPPATYAGAAPPAPARRIARDDPPDTGKKDARTAAARGKRPAHPNYARSEQLHYAGSDLHLSARIRQAEGLVARVRADLGGRMGAPSVAAEYDILDIGPLPPLHSATYATAVNRLGQVVGYSWEGVWPGREAFLWTPGGSDGPTENPQIRALGNFSGEPASMWHSAQAWAVNGRGQVVGWANGTDYLVDRARACLWYQGTITDLGALTAYGASMAHDINDAGQVVGWSETDPGTLGGNQHAFICDSATRRMIDLGVDNSFANAVNAFAQLVGAYFTDEGEKHVLYWDPTNGAWDLHGLVTLGGSTSEAAAINDRGHVVGWATSEDRTAHGFWCDLSTGQVKHIGGPGESFAMGINNQGVAVGQFKHSLLIDHPLRWTVEPDVVEDLNELLPPEERRPESSWPPAESGWELFHAWDINDAGQIVGAGTHIVEGIYYSRGYRVTPRGGAS